MLEQNERDELVEADTVDEIVYFEIWLLLVDDDELDDVIIHFQSEFLDEVDDEVDDVALVFVSPAIYEENEHKLNELRDDRIIIEFELVLINELVDDEHLVRDYLEQTEQLFDEIEGNE
jgi:hypothetical protein